MLRTALIYLFSHNSWGKPGKRSNSRRSESEGKRAEARNPAAISTDAFRARAPRGCPPPRPNRDFTVAEAPSPSGTRRMDPPTLFHAHPRTLAGASHGFGGRRAFVMIQQQQQLEDRPSVRTRRHHMTERRRGITILRRRKTHSSTRSQLPPCSPSRAGWRGSP